MTLPLGTRVRNRTTGECATVVGPTDSFGLIGIVYDDPPEGVHHASVERLERIAGDCAFCGHGLRDDLYCESCEEFDPPATISKLTLADLGEMYGVPYERQRIDECPENKRPRWAA